MASKSRKKVNLGGVMLEIVSAAELAKMCNRSKVSILNYEKTGLFPPAPLKVGVARYYPIEMARKLSKVVKNFKPGKAPGEFDKLEILRIFREEKEKLVCLKNQSPKKA